MNTFHVMLVLDETGSMAPSVDITLSAINEYIETLKQDKENTYLLSLVKFNSYGRVPFIVERDVQLVYPLTRKDYRPNAMTPLYDAIGLSINQLDKKDKVLFIIMTDGEENSSKEYTRQNIFDLITEKKELGWQFVFMGADQDAYQAGAQFGLSKGQTISFDTQNSRGAYNALAGSTKSYVSTSGQPTEDFFIDTDIREQ